MSSCPIEEVSEEQLEALKTSREEDLWKSVFEATKSTVLPYLFGSGDILSMIDVTLKLDKRVIIAGALRELAGYIASCNIENLKLESALTEESHGR